MKSHTTLTIDTDVLQVFSQRYPRKVSKMVEEFMRNTIEAFDDTEKVSKDQLMKELAEAQKLKEKQSARLATIQSQIESIEKKATAEKEQQTKKQKAKQEYIQQRITEIKVGDPKLVDARYYAEKQGYNSLEEQLAKEYEEKNAKEN